MQLLVHALDVALWWCIGVEYAYQYVRVQAAWFS